MKWYWWAAIGVGRLYFLSRRPATGPVGSTTPTKLKYITHQQYKTVLDACTYTDRDPQAISMLRTLNSVQLKDMWYTVELNGTKTFQECYKTLVKKL